MKTPKLLRQIREYVLKGIVWAIAAVAAPIGIVVFLMARLMDLLYDLVEEDEIDK